MTTRFAIICIFYALLMGGSVLGATKSPTSPPSPSLAPTSAPTDEKVGTPNAPTTPGGACLNDNDYKERWTAVIRDGLTGFDLFAKDMEVCAEACAATLLTSVSADYECGGFAQPACPKDLNAICIQDCFLGNDKTTLKFPELEVPGYTEQCAYCYGKLNQCGGSNCTAVCARGGQRDKSCRTCNEANCNPDFMICSGLNPALKDPAGLDFIPILIGAVAGGLGAIVLAIIIGAYRRAKTRRLKMLSPEEMAKLASSQSLALGSPLTSQGSMNPIGSPAFSVSSSSNKYDNGYGPNANNPVYNNNSPVLSAGSGGSNLTPYQQQYLAQQAALAQGGVDHNTHSRIAPSMRASQMVARAVSAGPSITASATPLVVMFEFIAERDDELTAAVGDRMLGIEQQDGWWLAQNEKGIMGLIPVSYTAVDTNPAPGPSKTVEPAF